MSTALAAAACGPTIPPGQVDGDPCASGGLITRFCEANLQCGDDGLCHGCGGPGEKCCDRPAGGFECTRGECSAYTNPNGEVAVCPQSGTCDIGQHCCTDDHCDSGQCDGLMCVDMGMGDKCHGSVQQTWWMVDANGCATTIAVQSDTDDDQKACADAAAQAQKGKLVTDGKEPACNDYCQVDTRLGTSAQLTNVCAYDDKSLETCENHLGEDLAHGGDDRYDPGMCP